MAIGAIDLLSLSGPEEVWVQSYPVWHPTARDQGTGRLSTNAPAEARAAPSSRKQRGGRGVPVARVRRRAPTPWGGEMWWRLGAPGGQRSACVGLGDPRAHWPDARVPIPGSDRHSTPHGYAHARVCARGSRSAAPMSPCAHGAHAWDRAIARPSQSSSARLGISLCVVAWGVPNPQRCTMLLKEGQHSTRWAGPHQSLAARPYVGKYTAFGAATTPDPVTARSRPDGWAPGR